MKKFVVLNKYGRVFAVADSLLQISKATGVPNTTIHTNFHQGKPIRGKFLVMAREKHERMWHRYGGKYGGDDHFAFCTPEELRTYKETEKKE